MRSAAILTIGDELMIGQIVDSNSAWIASFLDMHGWKVILKMGVRDEKEEILEGLRLAFEKADLVITTGGLGPTKDDLTKDALATFFNTPLVWHEETWQRLLEILKRYRRDPSELHKLQSYQPQSAQIINNDQGSAPGLMFSVNDKWLLAVPGVPHEMKHLLGDKMIHLLPAGNNIEHRFIRTAGEGETVLADMISDIENELSPDIKLAYLPSFSQVTLRLSAYGIDSKNQIDDFANRISERLGHLVYAKSDTTLSGAVGELLRSRKQTVGTAESCTGGYLSHLITVEAGSSDYYIGSIAPYAYEMKTSELGIPQKTLEVYGAVSEEVVTLMANNLREKLGVTWALATSGIAGPGGGTPTKPVGTIWIACAGPNATKTRLLQLTKDRISNIQNTAVASLVLLRKCILEEGQD